MKKKWPKSEVEGGGVLTAESPGGLVVSFVNFFFFFSLHFWWRWWRERERERERGGGSLFADVADR